MQRELLWISCLVRHSTCLSHDAAPHSLLTESVRILLKSSSHRLLACEKTMSCLSVPKHISHVHMCFRLGGRVSTPHACEYSTCTYTCTSRCCVPAKGSAPAARATPARHSHKCAGKTQKSSCNHAHDCRLQGPNCIHASEPQKRKQEETQWSQLLHAFCKRNDLQRPSFNNHCMPRWLKGRSRHRQRLPEGHELALRKLSSFAHVLCAGHPLLHSPPARVRARRCSPPRSCCCGS